MTRSSDSGDDHRLVQKNGLDQSQDRSIRDLHRRMEKNDEDHGAIMGVLSDLRLSAENVRGDIRGSKMVASAIAFVFALVMGAVGWMVSRSVDVIDRIDTRTIELDKSFSKHETWGIERGQAVTNDVMQLRVKHEHDIDEVREDVKELDRSERQRGK